ncbi:MAG: aldo/keto reductase [Actinocatenispora sp.]
MPRTDLPTVPLGRTDLRITRIGFGTWAVGGAGYTFGWGAQDDDDSVRAIRYAVEQGVNWIDTAAVYGLGHAEEIVRRALEPYGPDDRPYLFTKCGLVWDATDRRRPPRRAGSPDSIRREVDASLSRLGVERIDLYQMHWPSEPDTVAGHATVDGAPLCDYWQALLDLRDAGKVRAVGLSNHDAKQLAEAADRGHVDTLQPPFSAVSREAAQVEIPWCAEHDTGVIVYSPMQSGLLSGAFTRERAAGLPADDWRRRSGNFVGGALDRNLDLARRMEQVAHRYEVPLATVAVAWTLAWPGVTGAIVGARRPEQVPDWLPAARLTLDSDDLDDIAEAIERSGAGAGPTRPRYGDAAAAG